VSDVIRSGVVKTRKEHKCHGCLEEMPIGSKVQATTFVDDGIYTIYMCDKCISWCNARKCRECIEMESAFEGYIRDCISMNSD